MQFHAKIAISVNCEITTKQILALDICLSQNCNKTNPRIKLYAY